MLTSGEQVRTEAHDRVGRHAAWVRESPELWARWIETRDDSARQALVEHYLPFAHAIAARLYARRTGEGIEVDEYRQFAVVGLLEGIGRYQPEMGVKFTTFALPRIRGAVLNGLEHLTERMQQAVFRRRTEADRTESLAHEPLTGCSTADLLEKLGEIGLGIAYGFVLEGTGLGVSPEEQLPVDAYARVELRQMSQRLWSLVTLLPPRERDVLELHYRQGHPFQAIAAQYGLSKGRISQLHRQALLALRSLIKRSERCDVVY